MAEMFKVNAPVRKPLFEGVQGENEARSIVFDITPWVDELGDGAVTATAKRSQDSQPYPVTVTKDGNTVTWKPTSTDTAFAGVGSFQLEYTVDDVLAKTCIWSTMVAPSLDPAGDPPDPYDNWLAEMREIAADAIQAAQDADESADDAQAEVYEAEAWAKGTKNGTPVSSSDAQYQNNAKYFAEESYKNAEAWAVGQRGGVDVPSTDPTYENNSKYWAEQSLANQYGAYIVKSASGDIASFADGADNVPMKSVNVTITPKQSGSGDPSPSNVRPITGWTDAGVTVTGKNLFDSARFLEATNWTESNGVYRGADYYIATNHASGFPYLFKFPEPQSRQVCVSFDAKGEDNERNGYMRFEYSDGTQVAIVEVKGTSWTHYTMISNPSKQVVNVNFIYSNARIMEIKNFQIEYASTPTEFEQFGHTTPVPLGQTVYGGTVDVISGEGSETWEKVVLDGSQSLSLVNWQPQANSVGFGYNRDVFNTVPNGEVISDKYPTIAYSSAYYNDVVGVTCGEHRTAALVVRVSDTSLTTAAAVYAWLAQNPITVCFQKQTPTDFTTTPTQVATLLGTNNVWSDAGSVEVEYRADPTLAYNELANVIVSLGGNI